jgi:hypothetical protein
LMFYTGGGLGGDNGASSSVVGSDHSARFIDAD